MQSLLSFWLEYEGLDKKSSEANIPVEILKEVYDRGIGAFKTSPNSVRPNVKSKEQWAMARVNAFIRQKKTVWLGPDQDQAKLAEEHWQKHGLPENKKFMLLKD